MMDRGPGMSEGNNPNIFNPASWAALFRKKTATHTTAPEKYAYWQSRLHNLPASLELQAKATNEIPFSPGITTRKTSRSTIINTASTAELKCLAIEKNSNFYALLLGAYFTLLYRYTGEEDIIIACAEPGHLLIDNTALVSNAANIAFIRLHLTKNPLFHKLLETLNQTITTAYIHLPPTLQGILQAIPDDQNPDSLFQVQFSIEDPALIEVAAENDIPRPDLHLRITQNSGQLEVHLDYNVTRFETATIQRLLDHYQNLLSAITANPRQSLSELALLSSRERQQLLKTWNNTRVEFARVEAIHKLFESRVSESPDTLAIVFRGKHLAYRTLNTRANQLAHYLRVQGVGPDVLVGIYMERSIDAVTAILGVLKAGGAYLPLDASYPKDRLAFIMEDAQASILLTHANLASEVEARDTTVICLDSDWEKVAGQSPHNPQNRTRPEHLAFVLYTSGSTGNPKGVEVTHGNLVNYYFAWEHTHQLRTSISGVCQMAFFSFAVFQGDVIRALCSGKKLVLCSRETLLSPRQLFEFMRREKADFAEFVPVLLRGLLDFAEKTEQRLTFMKVIVVGADRWYLREHKRVQKQCGPETRFIHVYGLSETTLDSTYFVATDASLDDNQLVPVGRPFPNIQAYVLNRHKQPVPVGVTGTLYVGGAGIARGYHKRPGLTAEMFTADPFSENQGARLYNTGDLARYLPDGNIAFLGRSDHQVKIRGFRVELGEVEACLEQYPTIQTAIVQPHQTASGVVQLAAYYLTPDGPAPSTSDIQGFVQQKLPDFMVPSFFILLDALPLTPSGKINRRALPDPIAIAPPTTRHAVDTTDATHTDAVQKIVTDICNHALGTNSLAPNDNFSKNGADSLTIMTMVTGLENNFGIVLDEDDINPQLFATVNTLTTYVENKTGVTQ